MRENSYKKYFDKAIQYYRNAKSMLEDIEIEYGRFYKNQKKVQKSAGLCHLSLNYALKGYLMKKGLEEKKVASFTWDGLKSYIYKHYPTPNGKFKTELETAYYNVHIQTYYMGNRRVDFIKEGYNSVKYIIERLTGEKI